MQPIAYIYPINNNSKIYEKENINYHNITFWDIYHSSNYSL